MKLIDVLLRKNGHEQTREPEMESIKQRLNEVERKITQQAGDARRDYEVVEEAPADC